MNRLFPEPPPSHDNAPARHGGASRRWRPSALVSATGAVHAAAIAAVAAQPSVAAWAVGGVMASHLALVAAGLWPRSTLLGPNLLQLPAAPTADRPGAAHAAHARHRPNDAHAFDDAQGAHAGQIALTFDDGPDPTLTPRVLDLLDAYRVQATFFCIGAHARRHPELVREIARRGHAVENHSEHHRHHFSLFGPRRIAEEIGTAQVLLTELSGHAPRFFRAPAGLRNPFLEPVLCRLGLQLAAWTRRGFDSVASGDAGRVADRLLRGLAARDILLLHDGNPGRDAAGEPLVLNALPRVLDAIAAARLQPVTLRDAVFPPEGAARPMATSSHRRLDS
jgi:peptidoglycan/xylan/chitin deacetylase (PgdA/CDA1 family)